MIDDPARAAVIQHALEPYADRIATSGLAGISIGPVSGYAGLAAYAAGDLDAAERHLLDDAIARNVADGTRPHEARARLARSRVHAARGEREARGRRGACRTRDRRRHRPRPARLTPRAASRRAHAPPMAPVVP